MSTSQCLTPTCRHPQSQHQDGGLGHCSLCRCGGGRYIETSDPPRVGGTHRKHSTTKHKGGGRKR
jgi:hypothetical protein